MLTNELPTTVNYVGSDPPAQVQGRQLHWELGALEPHADKRLVLRFIPTQEGEVQLRPIVTWATKLEKRAAVVRPRLQLQLQGPQQCRSGEEVVFQILLHNSGTGPAQNLVIQAQLSEGLRHPQGATLEAHLPTLAAGESRMLPLRVTASAAGAQQCRIVASALAHTEVTAQATLRVLEPRLAIRLQGPSRCLVRGDAVYEIALSNAGSADTEPLVVAVQLPEWLDVVQVGEGGSYQAEQRTVLWHLPALAAGAARSIGLKVRPTTTGEGTLRVVAHSAPASITPVSTPSAPPPLQARSELAVRADGVPAIRLEVLDLEDPVLVGQEAIYEIRLLNQGTGPCSHIQLLAMLPEGAEYKGSSGPTAVRQEGNRLLFAPLASLPVRGEAVYRIRLRGTQPGDARFRVQLSYDSLRAPILKEESTQFIQP
jgi:uncharacterized repeat protein (TIGR01451 family)